MRKVWERAFAKIRHNEKPETIEDRFALPVVPEGFEGVEPPLVPSLRFGNTKRECHQMQWLLTAEPCCDEDVVYVTDDRDNFVRIRMQDFLDMGSPIHITVTIQPDDHLNKES